MSVMAIRRMLRIVFIVSPKYSDTVVYNKYGEIASDTASRGAQSKALQGFARACCADKRADGRADHRSGGADDRKGVGESRRIYRRMNHPAIVSSVCDGIRRGGRFATLLD